MQNKHGGSIRSHDCYLKRCVKNSLTQYSFLYVMESRVSSNCTRNIHWPPTAEKEVNRKGNTLWKIAKRRQSIKFAGPLNLVPFLVPVDKKKNHRIKFEMEEENTNLQIARKLPLQPLFFWLLNDRQDKFHKLWTFWEISLKQTEEN